MQMSLMLIECLLFVSDNFCCWWSEQHH